MKLNEKLLHCAKAIGVKNVGFECPFSLRSPSTGMDYYFWATCFGMYHSHHDSIGINPKRWSKTTKGLFTLAHEIIHSTGHPSRLARPIFVGERTALSVRHEEGIANVGARLLLKELGLWQPERMWKQYKRAMLGQVGREKSTEQERLKAKEAVKYILERIENKNV